jgi:hypothetical protein
VAYVGRSTPGPANTYLSPTDFQLVRRADLVALGPGADQMRVLLSAPDGVEALDVAELAVAAEGVAVVPRTPFLFDPRWWWALGGGGLLLAQIVIAFVALAVMRSRSPDRGNGRPYRRTRP